MNSSSSRPLVRREEDEHFLVRAVWRTSKNTIRHVGGFWIRKRRSCGCCVKTCRNRLCARDKLTRSELKVTCPSEVWWLKREDVTSVGVLLRVEGRRKPALGRVF